MIWHDRDRKTVFILGAGATRGALRHVLINGKRIPAPLNGDFFEVVEKFVAANADDPGLTRRYKRLRRVFQSEFPTRGRWPIDMEEAFSLLYVSKDFPDIYARRPGRRRTSGSRQEIEDFLLLTYRVLSAIESHSQGDTLYDRMVANLGPHDAVITLNYDTLLDSALVRAGWDPATGYSLSGGRNKTKWHMPIPPRNTRLNQVKLLKLHGSLNWYVRGSFSNLAAVFEKKPTKVLVTSKPRINEHKGFIRQIIPPIYGKFFKHDHWQDLWTAAHHELLNAEVFVVIGCSLVDSDFHLAALLGHTVALRKRRQNPFEAIIVVNGVKARKNWIRRLKGSFHAKVAYPRFNRFADHHFN